MNSWVPIIHALTSSTNKKIRVRKSYFCVKKNTRNYIPNELVISSNPGKLPPPLPPIFQDSTVCFLEDYNVYYCMLASNLKLYTRQKTKDIVCKMMQRNT